MNPIEQIESALTALKRVGLHPLSIKADVKAASDAVALLVPALATLKKDLNNPAGTPPTA